MLLAVQEVDSFLSAALTRTYISWMGTMASPSDLSALLAYSFLSLLFIVSKYSFPETQVLGS